MYFIPSSCRSVHFLNSSTLKNETRHLNCVHTLCMQSRCFANSFAVCLQGWSHIYLHSSAGEAWRWLEQNLADVTKRVYIYVYGTNCYVETRRCGYKLMQIKLLTWQNLLLWPLLIGGRAWRIIQALPSNPSDEKTPLFMYCMYFVVKYFLPEIIGTLPEGVHGERLRSSPEETYT